MKPEEYKQIYDKIALREEADKRILKELLREKESGTMMRGKRKKWLAGAAVTVAAMAAFVIGIARIPAAGSAAKDAVSKFTNLIIVNDSDGQDSGENSSDENSSAGKDSGENGSGEAASQGGMEYGYPISGYTYSASGEYLHVKADAPKKTCRMESMTEVSQALGVELLQSKEAYARKKSILYTPYVSKSGALNGVTLQNNIYAIGDIRDAKVKARGKMKIDEEGLEEGYYEISYREGEKYHSPIEMEITIRTDQAEGVDKGNHELDYAGRIMEADEGAYITTEIYEIKNLGVKALLTLDDTPGSYTWNKLDGEAINRAADAFFVYQGVEYRYVGAVSTETMKEFLETLEIPASE